MEENESNGTGLQILNHNGQPIKTIIGENAQSLSEILIANIKKVQEDANYVPQAKEIRDNVRELVNLARVEIDMFREVRKVVNPK